MKRCLNQKGWWLSRQWLSKAWGGINSGWNMAAVNKGVTSHPVLTQGFWNSPNSKLESRNSNTLALTKQNCMHRTFVSWPMWMNSAMRWLRDHPRLIFPWKVILFGVNGQSPSWRIWGSWGYDIGKHFTVAPTCFTKWGCKNSISKARTSPNEGSSEKNGMKMMVFPIGSMCGIFTNIDHKHQPKCW